MKTLLVHYLPSGESSKTKKLVDVFLKAVEDSPVETLDLLQTQVPFFNLVSMAAYRKRNYQGQVLDSTETKSLEIQDRLMRQFKSADVIVMAHPMHNFGIPGLVKMYLDAVILKGETFEPGKKMMAGKKSLTLFTSGGIYTPDFVNLDYPNLDTLTVSAKINFRFMGVDEAEVIGTSLMDPTKAPERLEEASQKIHALIGRWYKTL